MNEPYKIIKMHAPFYIYLAALFAIFTSGHWNVPSPLPLPLIGPFDLPLNIGSNTAKVIVALIASVILLKHYISLDISSYFPKTLDMNVSFDARELELIIDKHYSKELPRLNIQTEFAPHQSEFFKHLNDKLSEFKEAHVKTIMEFIGKNLPTLTVENSFEERLIDTLSEQKLLPADDYFSPAMTCAGSFRLEIKKLSIWKDFHTYRIEKCFGHLKHSAQGNQVMRSRFEICNNCFDITPSFNKMIKGMVIDPKFQLKLQHFSNDDLHIPVEITSLFKARIWPFVKLYPGLYCYRNEDGEMAPVGYVKYDEPGEASISC